MGIEGVYLIDRYGRHEETRTPDLYRAKVAPRLHAIDSKHVITELQPEKPGQSALFATNLLPTS